MGQITDVKERLDAASSSTPPRLTDRRSEDDPRFQRIRAKLTEAILTLAADKPAEQISVSELTSRAGVSRTTFYKHADSPAAFLATHLIAQLAPSMDPLAYLLRDTGPDYLLRWRETQIALLTHVRHNQRVYSHVFSADGQSVVLAMLSVYFERLFSDYVQEFQRHLDGPQPSDLWVAMAISQQVHNTIAMISSWLRTGMVEEPDVVVATYISLAPPWQLARFSEEGRTTLRRTREDERIEGQQNEEERPTSYRLLPTTLRRTLGTIASD